MTTQKQEKAIVITNTGALRFDIFKGPFTRDTEYLVSPFTSGFRYVPDVPVKIAKRILSLINNEGPLMSLIADGHGAKKRPHLTPPEELNGPIPESEHVHDAMIAGEQELFGGQVPLFAGRNAKPDLIPGYTTEDDAGKDGDDTIHSPITFYNVPNAFQASVGVKLEDSAQEQEDQTVDVVYNEFIQPWILLALEYLGHKVKLEDTGVYLEGKTMTDVIVEWVEGNWGKHC
jgi:hypothetical protein